MDGFQHDLPNTLVTIPATLAEGSSVRNYRDLVTPLLADNPWETISSGTTRTTQEDPY